MQAKLNESIKIQNMRVTKRGKRGFEEVRFDKITDRIKNLCTGLSPQVNPTMIAMKTINGLFDGISTERLDTMSAEIAESYKLMHPDYSTLASRILVSNLHKTTPSKFHECMEMLRIANPCMSSDAYHKFIMDNAAALDNMIIHDNDYLFSYFGFKTLEGSYLNKVQDPVLDSSGRNVYAYIRDDIEVTVSADRVEFVDDCAFTRVDDLIFPVAPKTTDRVLDRPQYVFMRVAIAVCTPMISCDDVDRTESKSQQRILDPHADIARVLESIKVCYKLMSQMYFTHATPTLFNACMRNQQLLSCFLLGTADSIEDIMHNLTQASLISKCAGGIGIHMTNIRARNSLIKGTNGRSSGLPRQLKLFNEAACTWDQGGRRKGSWAMYIEPHHGDIKQFLRLKLNQGSETERARDLFYALWVSDLFVEKARTNMPWYLFSDDTAPGLADVYDGMMVCSKCNYCANAAYAKFIDPWRPAEYKDMHRLPSSQARVFACGHGFIDDPSVLGEGAKCVIMRESALPDKSIICNGNAMIPMLHQQGCTHDFQPVDAYRMLYDKYVSMGRSIGVLNAGEIMAAVCEMQRESGTPYICFKDHVNRMSNQMAIGTIKSSNLCCEVAEWSSNESYACCTLASISLKKFLVPTESANKYAIDHKRLHEVVTLITRNLDRIIDVNNYPVPECVDNSTSYRPIGIGVQGLADVFAMMRIPFLSAEAARIDLEIFETIYHAATSASVDLAIERGSFKGFEHSPSARGMLAPDLWRANQQRIKSPHMGIQIYSSRYDFQALRDKVKMHGLRNSLMIAPMPTVSTSQILGNNESFEPFPSNIYVKTTLCGKFTCVNQYLQAHLMELNLWTDEIRMQITNSGSIQHIKNIPQEIREIYLTVWEMKQMAIMDRAAIRQAFVDQSQSLNIHVSNNSDSVLRAVFFHGHKIGLKTGSYYVKTQQAGSGAMKTNLAALKEAEKKEPEPVCRMEEGCEYCSS